jgi:uncharacterized membrane protein YeaQ/YmgE (transglycosylase-associated protein family)
MDPNTIVGALFVGLVIGALGRLVVPGRQPIGCLLTLLLGILGAVGGLAIARAANIDSWLLIVCCQVAVAAVGALIASQALGRRALRGPRRYIN